MENFSRRAPLELIFTIGAVMTGVGFFTAPFWSHILITVGACFMTVAMILWVYATKYQHDHELELEDDKPDPL